MSGPAITALLAAFAVWLAGRDGAVRLTRLSGARYGRTVPECHSRPASGRWSRTAAAAAGAGVTLLAGGVPGAALGGATALAVHLLARQLPRRSAAARERQAVADLPLAVDLLAACVATGASSGDAVAAVAAATGGPLGEDLHAVARAQRLGLPPAQAWRPLLDGARPARLRAVALALCRAEEAGTSPVAVLTALAQDARAAARADGEAAARRAGVRALAPLACCHLPAFVLLGVVPLVAGFGRQLTPG